MKAVLNLTYLLYFTENPEFKEDLDMKHESVISRMNQLKIEVSGVNPEVKFLQDFGGVGGKYLQSWSTCFNTIAYTEADGTTDM